MRHVEIQQVDAFTSRPFGGNPAGVVLDAGALSDEEMRKIAAERSSGSSPPSPAALPIPSRSARSSTPWA